MKTPAIPNYIVRRSLKAKNLRLKVTREDGLCVVVPRGFDENKIPALLKQKKVWIADAVKRVGETRRFLEPRPVEHLPNILQLLALGEEWSVDYRQDATHCGVRLRVENRTLCISGYQLNRTDVLRKLRYWLREKVREELFLRAESLANKHGLKLEGLMVKNQRTRWASCSAKRNLALNTKLLFLSPDLVRYVLIHELCHTIHMNHSKEFWRLVESIESSYKTKDRELREAWKKIPQWLF